jgi:hypothetical protein
VRKKRNTLRDTELKEEEGHRELAGEEKKERLREFHYMRFPKCGMELTEPIMLRKHIVAGLLALTLVL